MIQEVVRHISAMVHEARVVKKWSNPEYISSVRLLCNSSGGCSHHTKETSLR